MYLSNKQIDILRDHNARMRTLGIKPLHARAEVETFFGPALKLKYVFGPNKPKDAATIDPMHDRARSRKLGRKERIKPSRKGVLYYEVAPGVRVYNYGKSHPAVGATHAKRA